MDAAVVIVGSCVEAGGDGVGWVAGGVSSSDDVMVTNSENVFQWRRFAIAELDNGTERNLKYQQRTD